ncbi:MAG TPA: glutathione S-transferase family protein [Polyangia bacterium]|nr:glutathione S-transferase family protein [Polyangia bacterium]
MANYTLILGSKNYSSWSLRAWLCARHSGARFDEQVIALDTPETAQAIRAHSPSGRVPVLKDGDVTIWDSLAIAEYLAERHPEAKLWPADMHARAVARSVAAEMHSGFAALRSNMPMNVRRTAPRAGLLREVQADIARILDVWRDCRARFGAGGPFLFGGFTIADAMYAPVVSRLKSYVVPVEDAVCKAYLHAIWELPSMKEWRAAAASEPRVAKYDHI